MKFSLLLLIIYLSISNAQTIVTLLEFQEVAYVSPLTCQYKTSLSVENLLKGTIKIGDPVSYRFFSQNTTFTIYTAYYTVSPGSGYQDVYITPEGLTTTITISNVVPYRCLSLPTPLTVYLPENNQIYSVFGISKTLWSFYLVPNNIEQANQETPPEFICYKLGFECSVTTFFNTIVPRLKIDLQITPDLSSSYELDEILYIHDSDNQFLTNISISLPTYLHNTTNIPALTTPIFTEINSVLDFGYHTEATIFNLKNRFYSYYSNYMGIDRVAYGNPNNYTLMMDVSGMSSQNTDGSLYMVEVSTDGLYSRQLTSIQPVSLKKLKHKKNNEISNMNHSFVTQPQQQQEEKVIQNQMNEDSFLLDIIGFEMIKLENLIYFIRLVVADDVGIQLVTINEETPLLVNETLPHYTYEIVYNVLTSGDYLSISVTNTNSNVKRYGLCYNTNPLLVLIGLPINEPRICGENIYNIDNIKNISFEKNNIDLSNEGSSNTVYFTTHDNQTTTDYFFAIQRAYQNQLPQDIYPFSWDPSTLSYKCDFKLPARIFTGQVSYLIMQYNTMEKGYQIDSASLTDKFGSQAQLLVNSMDADQVGPIISLINLTPAPPIILPTGNGSTNIEFELTISDLGNGFSNGIIRFNMTTSGGPCTFYRYISMDSAISGDKFISVHNIKIPINHLCAISRVSIEYIELYDTQGLVSTGDSASNTNILAWPTIYFNYKEIKLNCSPVVDNTQSILNSFTSSVNTIDVTSSNRLITFTLNVTNLGAGISQLDPPPWIDIGDGNMITMKLVTYAYTTATFTLDYEVEYDTIYPENITVYSVNFYTNTYLAPSTFATDQLEAVGFSGVSTTNSKTPIITSTTDITSLGGVLYLYGDNFINSQCFIDYQDGNGYQNAQHSNINFIKLNSLIIKQTIKPIYIYVISNSKKSNTVIVTPKIVSTPITPSNSIINFTCAGTPQCGGSNNGNCTANGCVCINDWTGNDCLSKQIVIPLPTTNTTHPTTPIDYEGDLPNGEKVSFSSLISIIEIRELNFKNEIIQRYPLPNWIFTNKSNEQSTNFLYSTNITNPSSNIATPTKVDVNINWFSQEESITFANEIIQMKPSTIKYNIEMNHYPFSSKLNKLQLIMSITLQNNENDKDSCSNQEYGQENSNFEYLKLKINSQSIYARFIKRAIVDEKIIIIENQLIESDSTIQTAKTATVTEALVGILIPNYNEKLILDPDFSVLIDSNSNVDNEDSLCTSTNNNSSGLSKTQLAGIIVACCVFGVAAIIISLVVLYKKNLLFKIQVNRVLTLQKL